MKLVTCHQPYSKGIPFQPTATSWKPLAYGNTFNQRQSKFRERWSRATEPEQVYSDMVVIPSITFDQETIKGVSGVLRYEERLLCSLLKLQNPATRLVYVTSQPIHPSIVDYYLSLIPGTSPDQTRHRLLLLTLFDTSPKPLTAKILKRPRLMQRIRDFVRPNAGFISCFNVTDLERQLAIALNLPLYGATPDLQHWGTKSGSRQLFADCGIPHPAGSALVYSPQALSEAIARIWERQPQLQRIMVKLDEGLSGMGNALLDLRPLQHLSTSMTYAQRVQTVAEHLPRMRFQTSQETWETFQVRIADVGALAEAFVEGTEKRSPSVQINISPSGQVDVLSTHEQILGGPDGQTYLGCRFPADSAYRLRLQDWGLKVGQALAQQGVMDRFAVDFLAVRCPDHAGTPEEWNLQAIEVNLRKGGTTHPYMTLKELTNGHYCLEDGTFCDRNHQTKHYIASDALVNPHYKGLTPNDLTDIMKRHRLFDPLRQTGAVFHLLGCLSEYGKLGVTCIGNSAAEATAIYDHVIATLEAEAGSLKTSEQALCITHQSD